jgi:UDP-N-acetyl-D-galactosamine dehydrogenase
MSRYAARNVIKLMLQNDIDVSKSKVGVMGITFKEDCPDIRNSKVVDLVKEFEAWGVNVIITDPYADADEVMQEYGVRLSVMADLYNVDALVVAVGHQIYRQMELTALKKMLKSDKPVLADLKALYNRYEAAKLGLTLFRF